MKRFKNILVYVNLEKTNHCALAQGVWLAKTDQAKLTLVTVIQNVEDTLYWSENNPLHQAFVAEINSELEALAQPHRQEGIEIHTKVLWGRPFIQIIRQVQGQHYDLVLKTAEGKASLGDRLFGNTAMRLFRKCPCPVWVVKPAEKEGQITQVAAAVDVLHQKKRGNIGNAILSMAASLAQRENAQLHVVHAWEVFGQHMLRHRIPLSDLDKMVEGTRTARERMLHNLVQAAPEAAQATQHLIRGDAASVMPAFIEHHQIDVLVMGTLGRAGVPGFLIGNTAEHLLHNVNCSVLAIKPESFVSPIPA